LRAETIAQSVLFPDLVDKPLQITFDHPHTSSDGGAVLVHAADRAYHLIDGFAHALTDTRAAGKVRHAGRDLVAQRVYAIACGYPDGNDAARLNADPVQRILVRPTAGADTALASQPTLSRFENAVGPRALYRVGQDLARRVIARHRARLGRRVRRITIDLDPTDDPTYGGQQLSFFNGHYDGHCYLPVLGYLTFNDEAEQYLCAAVLRPGNAPATRGGVGLLRRLVRLLRAAFPTARIRVRLDGGFAAPEVFAYLDGEPRLDYVVALGSNAVLQREAEPLMRVVRPLAEQTGQTAHVYSTCQYQARTWDRPRRVIMKAEVVVTAGRAPRDNPRFVVTNLPQSPRFLYETVYCDRGDIENRIKELHHGVALGRTSCTRFWANQLRVLLSAAAYILLQEVRLRAARTRWARAQVWTLRQDVLKLGAHLIVSVRRYWLRLPHAYPYLEDWQHLARALGAPVA